MSHPHQHIDTPPISSDVENNTADKLETVETKDIVTPYAFGVANSLLGKRLATVTFYKASRNVANQSHKKTTRSFLRIGGAFMLFWTVLLTLDAANEANYFRDDATVSNVIDSPNRPGEKNGANDDIGVNEQAQNKGVHENGLQEAENIESDLADFDDATSEPSANTYSIVAWIKGLITELGLGFGWAALYYSVFTAWFNGKTPGKRLLNIQVLKLDGSGLSLWESFGRYGGYGAGLATGLLGFVQIYWDPNRQAIQDKISETLVISTRD